MVLNAVSIGIILLCEPGARMTIEFEMFEENLNQCDWYTLPIEMQQMYMIFLSNTQSPIQMSSYGGIVCDRETLKKVFRTQQIAFNHFSIKNSIEFCYFIFQIFNKAFSYFNTLRQFK